MNKSVSKNNPCPFLRAMAAYGFLKERAENIFKLTKSIAKAGGNTEAEGKLSKGILFIIALIANGLNPIRILKSLFLGPDIGNLRNGPLDKKGSGSRIIDANGSINSTELNRLESYSIELLDPDTQMKEKV